MRSIHRVIRLTIYVAMLALALLGGVPARAQAGEGSVHLLTITGAITPIVQQYIAQGIDRAEAEGAAAVVIQLDTPGGSTDVMGAITQRMLLAEVPLVVYVAPSGAHAASAGTFVTLAAHIAAMAPGTSIGAASPVSGSGEALGETEQAKAIAVLESDIKGLAQRRGEDAVEWAAAAVREARAATAEEALELGVIDVIARDLDDLLAQLDGREVELRTETVTLQTADAPVAEMPMSPIQDLLHTITNPNIAFILLTIGINGILFELASPGGYAAGIIGVIALLLALYALGVLSVNYAGLLFIVLAFILFVVDIKAASHGVLTAAGIGSFALGSIILFDTPFGGVSVALVLSVASITGLFFAFVVTKALRARGRPAITGSEELIGHLAEARTALAPSGMVFLLGELWSATAAGRHIAPGEMVRVVRRDGFRLWVEPAQRDAGDR